MVRQTAQVLTKLTLAGGRACAKTTPRASPARWRRGGGDHGLGSRRGHPGGEDGHALRCGAGRGAGGAAAKRTNAIASGTTDTDNTYFENGFTERSELLRKEGRKEEEG